MNDFRDYNDYLMHYGVKGMHWGIRRYQPYPKGHKVGIFLGSEESIKKHVEKHKKEILHNPNLTKKYYDYLTDDEIARAKKRYKDVQDLHRSSVDILKRPSEIVKAISMMAATAVAVAGVYSSPFGQFIRAKLKPIFSKVAANAFRKPPTYVVETVNKLPLNLVLAKSRNAAMLSKILNKVVVRH